jgi:hypothetical protein
MVWKTEKEEAAIREGNELYKQGKLAEAIEKYKYGFPSVVISKEEAEIVKRIVEYEVKAGNAEEARKWIEKGLKRKLEITYESPAAKKLFRKVKKEREEAVARKQAEREAKSGPNQNGKERVLRIKGGGLVPVAVSEQALNRLIQLSVAEDNLGIAEMILSGQAWNVTSGTKVVVIDEGVLRSEVRIMDGPQRGKAGWVPSDFLKKD